MSQNQLGEHIERAVIEKLQGVVAIYLLALDISESAHWYEKFLGYKVTHKGDIWSLEKPGYLKIILSEVGCDTHPVQFENIDGPNAVMMIGAPDTEEYHTFVRQNGVEANDILDRGICGKSFRMTDPAGNHIMVDAL